MASIRWTSSARHDLEDIVTYIAQDSPTSALTFFERIRASVEPLGRFPRLGRVVPEYGNELLRELIVGHYRVVYILYSERIDVVAVVHGSRELRRNLMHVPPDPA